MKDHASWGLVATVKAPVGDILRFAAYHLEAGAHRLYIYLDAPNPEAYAALKAHPKIRVTLCDAAYWKKRVGKPPIKHQVRQSVNATHAYHRPAEVDWLIHMDVDEFLVTGQTVGGALSALPGPVQTARCRPMEALSDGDGTGFKAFVPNGPDRNAIVDRLYPTFGRYVKGGFLSHVAGKAFVRTGLEGLKLRIHNVFHGEAMNPAEVELSAVDLAHCHATTWEAWRATYGYRLEKGSYRADLAPARPSEAGGVSLHDLFRTLKKEGGNSGLRAFFNEICADTGAHRARLEAEGLLRRHNLNLEAKLAKHFG